LLRAGVDPHGLLRDAIRYGGAGIVDLLIAHGANPSREYALASAAKFGDCACIERLIRAGADIKASDFLSVVIESEDLSDSRKSSVADLLLRRGAEPRNGWGAGWSRDAPLGRAIKTGSGEIALSLIKYMSPMSVEERAFYLDHIEEWERSYYEKAKSHKAALARIRAALEGSHSMAVTGRAPQALSEVRLSHSAAETGRVPERQVPPRVTRKELPENCLACCVM